MKKYLARFSSIWLVEVEKESESCVWIRGRKRLKTSSYESYFDTFEDAKASIVSECNAQVERYKKQLHAAKSALGSAEALTINSVRQ